MNAVEMKKNVEYNIHGTARHYTLNLNGIMKFEQWTKNG